MKDCPTCNRPVPEPIEDCEECKNLAKTSWIGDGPPKCPKHSHLKTNYINTRNWKNDYSYQEGYPLKGAKQSCLLEQATEEAKKHDPGRSVYPILISCPCPKCRTRCKI